MTHPRPFRFGVLGETVDSRETLIGTARAAEEAGYATFLIRDHFIRDPFGHQLAPLTALATVAAATETLRVGTLVLDNDYRHPVVLAKEAATLDVLSGGRLELGLGAGWLRAEYEQAGIPFEPPGVRIDRMEESIRVLKGLFGGTPLTFAGRHYRVTNLESFPTPPQRPHPPLLIGGGGKRMLSIAAREADIVGVLNASVASGSVSNDPAGLAPDRVAEKVGWIRDAAGARFAALELSMIASVVVADDHRAAAERFAHEHGWDGIAPDEVLAMPSVFLGTIERIVEQMLVRRDRFGVSYFVVSDGNAAAFAPVVARLAGR